ncbi:MAG: Ig-like domain-containing protein [Propionicimonas sp.]
MSLSHFRPGRGAPRPEIQKLSRLRIRLIAGSVAVLLGVLAAGTGLVPDAAFAAPARPAPVAAPNFGPNVKIFDPSMPVADIQATVDAITATQVNDEMGTNRYSLLFKPGTYGSAEEPLIIQVGYYTEVAGLGQSPTDVTINGHVDVYNRCREATGCFALDSFWRSVSNLTINVTGLDGCRAGTNFWAASQASPMRRVNITGGKLSLMDFCTDGPQFASGGFIADSKTGDIVNGSQQQYLVRDSNIGAWSNGVWNQVFAGVQGAPAESYPEPPYTTLAKSPAGREKPYLFIDAAGAWQVFVPAPRSNYSGTTWESGPTLGRAIALSKFFIAKPSDSVAAINSKLAKGLNLLFTPGVYDVEKTIAVKAADTVVLGMGLATLTAVNGAVVMTTADVPGIDIAGITIDAGTKNSPVLLQVGTTSGHKGTASAANPTALQDVFFRVGGPHVGKATVSLEVNTDNTILDDIWAWRADHGKAGSVGWDINTGQNGVIINGDNVTATGLFVEHYQQYNVIWNGENGRTVFFQNELPYDAPDQAAWQHDGVLGWAGYKVADTVTKNELWGGGSYVFNNVDPTIHASVGFEVPRKPGVKMHNLSSVQLGAGTLDHVINDKGLAVNSAGVGIPSCVVLYPSDDATPPTVAITDNVDGDTATGKVTFTFTFSEDVCSFTADDIVVTGGSRGSFTRVDAKTATLVVPPAENTIGTIDVSMAEATYTDLPGTANTVAASAQQGFNTTTPLTVAITDNVPTATATGDVTFAFAFNRDVGTSFTADDVVTTGGTTGAFVRVDATHATLVVSPPADSTGTVAVSVAAGTFTDLAGIVNAASATAQQAFNTTSTPPPAPSWALTFDDPAKTYTLTDFGNSGGAVVADPTGGTNKVATVSKAVTAAATAGSTVSTGANLSVDTIPFTADQTRMTMSVYSPAAGVRVRMKAENAVNPGQNVETDAFTTVAGAWETLTFDFGDTSTHYIPDGPTTYDLTKPTQNLNLAGTYNKVSVFFDYFVGVGGYAPMPSDRTYFFDDLIFLSEVAPPPPPVAGEIITFDESTPPVLTGFGGAADSTIAPDPADAANSVAKVVKEVGAEIWAGTTVSNLANQAIAKIGFSSTQKNVTARVWSPDAGIQVRLKVENATNGGQSVETEATTTVAGGWDTLTFDFANPVAGTAALDLAGTYNKVSIFFDFGTVGAGKTYYADDLDFTFDGEQPPPPPASLAITFDDPAKTYTLTDFGNYGGAVVADPAGGTNKVATVSKAVDAAATAGTTVSTGANLSVDTIPFTAAKTKMTMRVYSPAAGVRVRMKVENAANPGQNVETDAFTTTSGAWETLTFDFGDTSTHYIPDGPTTYDLTKPTQNLNLTSTYNKVSVFFDYFVGVSGYAPMPSDRTYFFDGVSGVF